MFTIDPYKPTFIDTLDLLIKIIGGLGALYLFWIGLKRYAKDQSWKRMEFVALEIKDFTADKFVRNSLLMLDWGERYIELFPDKPNYQERFVKVDRTTLKKALQFHELRISEKGKDRFTTTEVAIRDNFDAFLFYFERFNHFLEAKLISLTELKPYLNYWIETISENMEEDVRNVLFHYIQKYKFTGTQMLFLEMGKDIRPKTDISSTK